MKLLRFALVALMAFSSFGFSSCCKDDEDETEKDYLNGTLTIAMPLYVKYGDVIHIDPTGAYRSDENDTLFYYSWYNPFTGKTDTLRKEGDPVTKRKDFDFVVSKDTVASFTVSVYCWADGYYNKSATQTFQVVKPGFGDGTSLQGYDFLDKVQSFTDARDGKKYYYTTVSGTDWMIQNLAWEGSGTAYQAAEAMSDIFGRYYTWDEAAAACPAGWHLPSDAEFSALGVSAGGSAPAVANSDIPGVAGALMGNIYFNKDKMWAFSPDVKITNSLYFTAIPVGFAINAEKANFRDLGNYAIFWTSDAKDADSAWARYINVEQPDLFAGEYGKGSILASVRCVK